MKNENPYLPPTANVESKDRGGEHAMASGELSYAGFWRRFGAFWIDAICLLPLIGINYYFSEKSRLFNLYWFIPGLLIGLWFHVYLTVRYGGTPGKLLLKTRVAMLDGAAVTIRAAMLRYSVLLVLTVLGGLAILIPVLHMSDELYFSLSYLSRSQKIVAMAPSWYRPLLFITQIWIWSEFVIMMFNQKRRALLDFMAGTVVVRTGGDG